ncbi:MAG: PTS sugar transporter subunit IIA [Treponema sp.]|nr:PTS sugar transporter subunit IIA [Treponema sp.]
MTSAALPLETLVSPERVLFFGRVSKREALEALADALGEAPQVKDRAELRSEILKRDELMSTAIGRGIAVPHARLASVTDLAAAVGLCPEGIAGFEALDDEPVRILFMVAASSTQRDTYLRTLSYLCGCLKRQGLRERLLAAHTPEEAYRLLVGGCG